MYLVHFLGSCCMDKKRQLVPHEKGLLQFSWKLTSCVLFLEKNVSRRSSPFSNNSLCSTCKPWQMFHCFLFRLIFVYLGEPAGYVKPLFCEKKFMSQVWLQLLPWRSDRKRCTNPAEGSEQIKLVRFIDRRESFYLDMYSNPKCTCTHEKLHMFAAKHNGNH